MILPQQVENAEQNASATPYQYTDLVTFVTNQALQYTTPIALPDYQAATRTQDSGTYNKSIGYYK